MKTIFTFLAFCFLAFTVRAQHPYIPIPEDSAMWITTIEDWHEGEPNPVHTFKYRIGQLTGKDTIILGKRYFVPTGSIFIPPPPPADLNQFPASSGSWYRQDTLGKKIYYIRNKSRLDKEEVSYDFSLQVGDTITDSNQAFLGPKTSWLGSAKVWVQAIDSVFFPDNTWRYRWHFRSDYANGQAKATQIEGVGYTTGFYEDPFALYHFIVGYTSGLTCFGVKGQWLYHKPNPIFSQSCDSLIARDYNHLSIYDRSADLERPMFYPNPVNGSGTINLNAFAGSSSQSYSLRAYDMLGRCVLQEELQLGGSASLLGLPAGTYLFRLADNAGKLLHQEKIMVQ